MRRRRPSLAEAEDMTLSTWSDHVRVSLKTIPKWGWTCCCGIMAVLATIWSWTLGFLSGLNAITADFVGFTVRSHFWNHIQRLSVLCWSLSLRPEGEASTTYEDVSSAKRFVEALNGISFTYTERSRGLNTAPCGTPACRAANGDVTPSTTVACCRPVRKLVSHLWAAPLMPAASSLPRDLDTTLDQRPSGDQKIQYRHTAHYPRDCTIPVWAWWVVR